MGLQQNFVQFHVGKASQKEIFKFLLDCDSLFIPSLSSRVNIEEYSAKIFEKAKNFEAWSAEKLIGLTSAYYNDLASLSGFISNACLLREFQGRGVGTQLLNQCLAYGRTLGFKQVDLEVGLEDRNALDFYSKAGFLVSNIDASNKRMFIRL
jgi:GNAT superfamily N-acetyltransferase